MTRTPLALSLTVLLGACSSAYYSMWEKFGYQKRDILVERVQDGRKDQADAQKQFQSAFDAFKALTNFQGGNLETTYKKLSGELDRCKAAAGAVTDRIGSIEKVAKDLFAEWKKENETYTSADLKANSEKMLLDTQRSYDKLVGAMRAAEGKMKPVLAKFGDQVLFLKHNLNAQAITSLQSEVVKIEGDVGALIADMKKSIEEADAFIASMKKG